MQSRLDDSMSSLYEEEQDREKTPPGGRPSNKHGAVYVSRATISANSKSATSISYTKNCI